MKDSRYYKHDVIVGKDPQKTDDIFTLEDNIIRHDALKTAYLIFSYLMRSDNK